MGKYEVTQEQWERVMGNNPSQFKGPKNPVECVSWDDCQEFLKKLNALAPKAGTFRLPTEAEWEYACRAGTTRMFGESDEVEALDAAGWYGGNSGLRLHRVGEKRPNRWGIYDMHGNVWEWCQDWAMPYSKVPATDPQGPAQGEDHVLRGGCWRNPPGYCRSAARDFDEPDDRSGFAGFRVAVDARRPRR
jgi:formylglycine-generating enzyme required for sulfatase activity